MYGSLRALGDMLQLDLGPLVGAVVGWLRDGWSQRSRVDQRRRRLRQLVAMVRAVTDAANAHDGGGGSLSAWLRELRAEAMRGQRVLDDAAAGPGRRLVAFLRGAEAHRLAEAVDDLERLAAPGGDLATFLKLLRLDAATTVASDARRGAKRKRAAEQLGRRRGGSGGLSSWRRLGRWMQRRQQSFPPPAPLSLHALQHWRLSRMALQ